MTSNTRLRREHAAEIRAVLDRFPSNRSASAAVELLYFAQAAYGHLTAEAVEEVAEIVGMDATRVRGLVGFYSLLREDAHGGFVVQYCTDLPCALRGAESLWPKLCEKLGVAPDGGTSDDGLFTVEKSMCLAACDRAPMMQVNLEYFYDLDEAALDAIVADLRRRASLGRPRRPPFGFGPPSQMDIAASEIDRA